MRFVPRQLESRILSEWEVQKNPGYSSAWDPDALPEDTPQTVEERSARAIVSAFYTSLLEFLK